MGVDTRFLSDGLMQLQDVMLELRAARNEIQASAPALRDATTAAFNCTLACSVKDLASVSLVKCSATKFGTLKSEMPPLKVRKLLPL